MDCVELDSSELQANWNQMLYQVSATFSMLLLYALYIVLFTFSMYTVIRQNPAGRRFFLVISSIMFLLGTCDVIVSVFLVGIAIKVDKAQVQGSSSLPHLLQLYNTFFIVDAILMVANNLVTDVLFSYRCYFVWGLRKWVLIGPGLGMVATVVLGSFTATGSESLPKIIFLAPYLTAVATSVLLMCLTAGRIWYIRREAREASGRTFYPGRDTAIAMIIESGSLYCLAIIVWVVAQSIIYEFPNSGPESVYIFFGVTSGVWSQIVNIAPTLILVRIGLGKCQWIQDSTQSHGIGPGPMTFGQNSNIASRSIGNPVHTVDFGSVMEMNDSNSTAFTRSK
ncbi:hypothetical protein MSAN_00212700 [Mycena sanguinolenta]|uniref:Uncharacterized protein n=1 Tax=Mycena sanguinolenta TaxID=230812 RepID=A0A8H7DKV5_9AGAR|nr:hypothetical protein MSAN_00212700 [Mycena sanguinolenta]